MICPIRGSTAVDAAVVAFIGIVLATSYYFWISGLFSSASHAQEISTRSNVRIAGVSYYGPLASPIVCVHVHNIGLYTEDLGRYSVYIKDSNGVVAYFAGGNRVVVSPGAVGDVCFEVNTGLDPGKYTVDLMGPGGGYDYAIDGLVVEPECDSNTDCAPYVELSGNTLIEYQTYCESGICQPYSSDSYVCTETNALACDSLILSSGTYYCILHTVPVWSTALMEYYDDLNDNDCDGTVERECYTCESCTHELNFVAPSVADAGYAFLLHLSSDIYASASDLYHIWTYWGGSQSACIVAEGSGYSAPNPIVFDGEDHFVSVPGTPLVIYRFSGVEVRNVTLKGAKWGADLEGSVNAHNLRVYAALPIISSYSGTSLSDSNLFCNDSYSAYGSAAINVFWSGIPIRNVRIEGNCLLAVDSEEEDMDFQDVYLSMENYDYHVSPKPYSTDAFPNMYCSNGKTVKVLFFPTDANIVVDASTYCGYIINSNDNNIVIDLNGQTLDGFGIGFDSGNIVIRGPGAITGSHTGVFVDWYTSTVTVDLAYGDVSICGNYYDFYGYGFFPKVQCTNCGNGYYLRYSIEQPTVVDCNAECLAPCS